MVLLVQISFILIENDYAQIVNLDKITYVGNKNLKSIEDYDIYHL